MGRSIKIDVNINLYKIENYLQTLKSIPEQEVDFVIPANINLTGFGSFPLLFLLFYTWLRSKKGRLMIDINTEDNELLRNFSGNYIGYTLLLSAWNYRSIVDIEGIDIKKRFRKFTQQLYNKIDFLQDLPNDNLLIPIFDHYSKDRGLSHWFYNENFQFYKSPEQLDNTIYRIFSELSKIYKSRFKHNTKSVYEDLQVIVWELMSNTHYHATKDYLNQAELSPNLRGLYLKIHRASKENLIKQANEYEGLSAYYNRIIPNDNANFILELSVFDSGPGLAKRFLGQKWTPELSVSEEVSVVKQCLWRGSSSVHGANGIARGFGLDNVLSTLSKKRGFLIIRSGKVSLYRDLDKSPHLSTNNPLTIELQDALTNKIAEYTKMPEAVGSMITMSYPLF